MAIILLAIGAILSAVGLYALVSGYPMIEIERGWASVIAGSVLLSGGLVVMALGLVLRALTRMRIALPAFARAADAPSPAMTEPSFAPIPLAPHAASPLGAAAPALVVAAPAAAAALVADHGVRPDAPASVAPPEPGAADVPVPDELESRAPPPVEPDSRDERAFDYEADPEAHVPPVETPHVEPTPAPQAAESDHVSFVDRDVAETFAPPPLHEVEETDAHDPSVDDLSHPKFALQESEEREPATDAPFVEHADEPTEAAHAEHSAEPIAEAPATAPEAPPANLSVIGRYDSEGTSYVMYSDGSIEAQSEAGIYRFGSMAELKAFIEG